MSKALWIYFSPLREDEEGGLMFDFDINLTKKYYFNEGTTNEEIREYLNKLMLFNLVCVHEWRIIEEG